MADPLTALPLLRYAPYIVEFITVIRENYKNPLVWSFFIKIDALKMTHRIRKYVLNGEVQEAARLKDSFKDTLALEAVAAAIIAQIAVTLINLPGFGEIHWTATAFAYTSLVSGILATFYSFYVQQILGNLHRAEDLKEWLTSTRSARWVPSAVQLQRRLMHGKETINAEDRIPSLIAAATLTAPARLLFFVLFTAWAVSELTLPLMAKELSKPVEYENLVQIYSAFKNKTEGPGKQQNSGDGIEVDAENGPAAGDQAQVSTCSATQVAMLEALRASILAQEESLRAQKTLLQTLVTNSGQNL